MSSSFSIHVSAGDRGTTLVAASDRRNVASKPQGSSESVERIPRTFFDRPARDLELPSLAPSSRSPVFGPRFRDVFCRRFGIAAERYEIELMKRCLSRRARLLAPLIRLVSPRFFALDELFADSIGRVRQKKEFKDELTGFFDHPANSTWLRRSLKLRLSVFRLRNVAREVLPFLATPGSSDAGALAHWN